MNKSIPTEALNQHVAVLGKTGSGKTFAAKSTIIEPLLEQQRRVGIVDPTSAWWGLRSSRDGKGPGFPILVLGGDHGDLPLPALGGAAVARLLVEQNVNLVADTSLLTVGERNRWFIDFAGTLYRLNRAPLHLVLDEAHNFAPQGGGQARDIDTGKMLHAANTLASGGRSRGIRLVMITQRPQKLHKDALTSADTLIAMRVLAPQDRQAVEDWIKGCGDIAQGKEVLNSLASLQRGEGWVWYPEGGHLQRVKFPPIQTFDSSATPTDGHQVAAPKGMAEIDLTEIKEALAEAVEEAEANDPKLLKKRIAELEAELEEQQPGAAADPDAIADAEERGYWRGRNEARSIFRDIAEEAKSSVHQALGNLSIAAGHVDAMADVAKAAHESPNRVPDESETPPRRHTPDIQRAVPRSSAGLGEVGNTGLRRMLIALAQRPQGMNRRQLGVRAGLSSSSGTFSTYLSKGRTEGWINGDANTIRITHAGLTALGKYEPLPTGRDLLAYWLGELGDTGASRLLEALARVYPKALSRGAAADLAGLSANSGTFSTYLSKLRTLELVTGSGELRASTELFD